MGNDFILKCFINQESPKKKHFFPLYFDSGKMQKDGVNFKETGFSKSENEVFVYNGTITREEYEQIGNYYFHVGNLSLDYLTKESKEKIGYLTE